MQWHPIETAPKHTEVLVYWPDIEGKEALDIGVFDGRGQWDYCLFINSVPNPTHWAELPGGPNPQGDTTPLLSPGDLVEVHFIDDRFNLNEVVATTVRSVVSAEASICYQLNCCGLRLSRKGHPPLEITNQALFMPHVFNPHPREDDFKIKLTPLPHPPIPAP
jgi:hypothetical protein